MNFRKFVLEYHKKLLAALMEQQLKTPLGYDNESNIEISVAFEKSLVKLFPHDLIHKGQKFSSTKRDLLYVRFRPLFPDLVEVKTGEYDFEALFKRNGRGPGNRTVGNYRYMNVTYKKQKGQKRNCNLNYSIRGPIYICFSLRSAKIMMVQCWQCSCQKRHHLCV